MLEWIRKKLFCRIIHEVDSVMESVLLIFIFFFNKVFKNCQPTIIRPRAWTMQKVLFKKKCEFATFPSQTLRHRNSYLSPAVLILPALSFLNPLLSALLPLCFTPASHCCASQQMSTLDPVEDPLHLPYIRWLSFCKRCHSVPSLLYFNNVFCLFQIMPWVFAPMLKTKGEILVCKRLHLFAVILIRKMHRCTPTDILHKTCCETLEWDVTTPYLSMGIRWLNCCFILLM